MAYLLPKLVVFKSNFFKYASYVRFEMQPNQIEVTCSGEHVLVPEAKVEIESSKNDSKYVHIRFCHNNKYWERANDNDFLVAINIQPEEDVSKRSCTLFEPILQSDGLISFRHVQTGWTTTVGSDYPFDPTQLFISNNTDQGGRDLFSFVNFDSLVMLPKYVAFKGYNGKYLTDVWSNGIPWLQFSSDDPNDSRSAYTMNLPPLSYCDGHINIYSLNLGKYWRRSPNWIWSDTSDPFYNITPDTMFWPVKVDDDTIALRNAGNGLFCQALTADNKTNCLNAASNDICTEAKLKVVELVLEREINNVVYQMESARIVDDVPYLVGSGSADNTSDQTATLTITVSYQEAKSTSFTNNISISAGVSTTFIAGIPFIDEGKIEISSEVSYSHEWNTTTEETKSAQASYEVSVPPKTTATIDYVATKGTCNIPFTYTQNDKSSLDGSYYPTDNADGIFNGVNSYNFHFTNFQTSPL